MKSTDRVRDCKSLYSSRPDCKSTRTGTEVTLAIDGTRVRADFIGMSKDGIMDIFEVKNGSYARFTHNQSIVYPKMFQKQKIFPVGKKAFNIYSEPTTKYNFHYYYYYN